MFCFLVELHIAFRWSESFFFWTREHDFWRLHLSRASERDHFAKQFTNFLAYYLKVEEILAVWFVQPPDISNLYSISHLDKVSSCSHLKMAWDFQFWRALILMMSSRINKPPPVRCGCTPDHTKTSAFHPAVYLFSSCLKRHTTLYIYRWAQ